MTSRAALRRAAALACVPAALVRATAAARTLVGTPGKDRLAGGPVGDHVINGDGGHNRRVTTRRCETVTRRYRMRGGPAQRAIP